MKRVLVTGAAGFIGFHTCKQLHELGWAVLGIDNFNSYYSVSLKRARAEQLASLGIEVIELDLTEGQKLQALADRFKPTHLLHLAAQAGVRYSLEAPEVYLKANIDGFFNMLEVARRHPHCPMVYASSSSVYGEREAGPFGVNDPTDLPVSLYAATKKANELLAHSYHKIYGLRMTGLRYFTVYGPWGRPDMAYYSFGEAILAGQPIRLFHGGEAERDFTYVDDAVAGTIAALELGADWAVFNIGNGRPQPLLKLVEALELALGRPAIREFHGAHAGDVPRTWADLSESQRRLKFAPQISLEEGIRRFAQWLVTSRTNSIVA
jgi:UDP-glucuronate 4-epimerase